MFKNYLIKDNIIYLEIDLKYEFGSFKNNKNNNIINEIKDFFNKKNINNKFNKIVLTCSGIIIGSIIILKNNNTINENNIKYVPNLISYPSISYSFNINDEMNYEENIVNNNSNEIKNTINENNTKTQTNNFNENTQIKENTNENKSNEIIITVNRLNGSILNIELENYLIGVLAAEMPASFNIEALKAQAVIARTYALKAKKNEKILTDTVSTQSYIDESQMRDKWGNDFDKYYSKIKNAVNSTYGEYLSYNGDYIEALYHSTNNGKTESSLDVFGNYYPYLISVTSQYDKTASSYLRETSFDYNTLSSKLGLNFNPDTIIEILSYTDGGNIKEISIDSKTFTGKNIRELLGLRSADFDIIKENSSVKIITRGYGHGVGLSQYGSNIMANNGYNYVNILSHYYPNTSLKK